MKEKTIEKGAGFTQGPWHCGQGNGTGAIFANNGERMTCNEKGATVLHPICHVANTFEENEDEANARLISQSPAMYQQCKLFEKMLVHLQMQGETGVDEELENVRELLASVEGGEG